MLDSVVSYSGSRFQILTITGKEGRGPTALPPRMVVTPLYSLHETHFLSFAPIHVTLFYHPFKHMHTQLSSFVGDKHVHAFVQGHMHACMHGRLVDQDHFYEKNLFGVQLHGM